MSDSQRPEAFPTPILEQSVFTGVGSMKPLLDSSLVGQASPFLGLQAMQKPQMLEKFPRPELNSLGNPQKGGLRNVDKLKSQDTLFE